MKKSILSVAFLLVAFLGYNQDFYHPINYQAVVRNGSGALVPNGSIVNFRFSILKGSSTGAVYFSETQSAVVNNDQGLVSLAIGNGTNIVGGNLGSADLRDAFGVRYLKVEMDPAGGTSFIDLGGSTIQSVARANSAIYANTAENGFFAVFKTTPLTASSSTITVNYTDAASTDILHITPNYNSTILPVSAVYWNSVLSKWQIYSATTGGSFPVGCTFNVMVVKP